MSEALSIGIQPNVYENMEDVAVEALLLIEKSKGRKGKRNEALERFYAEKGIRR